MMRSKQNLSHYHPITCNMGDIVPISMIPVLPADTVSMNSSTFIRVTPMAAPVMHKVDVRLHHFYVANRNLFGEDRGDPGNWEDFYTGGEDGMNTDTIPQITTTGTPKDLFDAFGLKPVAGKSVNAMPIRGFNDIINEFYRDQDLQAERDQHDVTIPKCCWEKDYATTARPWSQKGPSISLPVGDTAPIHAPGSMGENVEVYSDGEAQNQLLSQPTNYVELGNSVGPGTNALYANLAGATGIDPIAFREFWGLQRFMEENAKYGSRYPEKLRRMGSRYTGLLERPEFLAGGSQSISFSEVLQTANDATDRDFGVGDMYGHGIANVRSNSFKRRIDEHGYIITLLSVRPKSVYQDGVHREWLKTDREEYYDPFLADIGMQPVYNGELDLAHASGEREPFGFADRYDEYRSHPSCVSNEFRDVLDYWHLARKLTDPVLNGSFVECNPSKRIFNEQTQDSLWVMAHTKCIAYRNMRQRARTRLL